jgi:L-asparaginase
MNHSIFAALVLLSATNVIAQQPVTGTKPRVHVLATGGTISNMGSDPRRTGAELVAGITGLSEIADVTTEQFSNVASGSVTQEMLRDLARRIRALESEPGAPTGFIVTHGTDTMEETAMFLDLTLGTCSPVIITGAMRQANAVGADGPANLLNSVRVAVSPEARGRGTLLLLNDEIFLAREVTKSNTTRLNAFTAPEAGPAGVTDPDGIYFRSPTPTNCSTKSAIDIDKVEAFPRVDIVYSYIGADSTIIDALVAAGAKGIVLAGVGRGGSTPSQSRALRRATDAGVVVLTSNRTGGGRVGRSSNPDSFRDLPEGRGATIGAGDLNPQKARILLSLALATGMKPAAIASLITAVQ